MIETLVTGIIILLMFVALPFVVVFSTAAACYCLVKCMDFLDRKGWI